MTGKRTTKPYWDMTTAELAAATAEFDEEHVEDKFRPLSAKNRAIWKEIQSRLRASSDSDGTRVIAIRVEKALLDRCTAVAKKKRISRDLLIARGLKAILAVEGEM
jgi:hypothetical protein